MFRFVQVYLSKFYQVYMSRFGQALLDSRFDIPFLASKSAIIWSKILQRFNQGFLSHQILIIWFLLVSFWSGHIVLKQFLHNTKPEYILPIKRPNPIQAYINLGFMFCIRNTFHIVCVAFSVTALPKHLSSKRPYLTAHWTYEGLLNLYANIKLLHNRKITISISSYLWKMPYAAHRPKVRFANSQQEAIVWFQSCLQRYPKIVSKVFSKLSQSCPKVIS